MSLRKMHGSGKFVAFITTALLSIALFAGVFGIVWSVSGITTFEYQIGELENRKARALKQRKIIEAELSSLRTIQNVWNKDLSLTIPDRRRIIYVKRDNATVRRVFRESREER